MQATIDTTEPNQDATYYPEFDTYTLHFDGTLTLQRGDPPTNMVWVWIKKAAVPPTTPTAFESFHAVPVVFGIWSLQVTNYPGPADGVGDCRVYTEAPEFGGLYLTNHIFMPQQNGNIDFANLASPPAKKDG